MEVIIRQTLSKYQVIDPGDSKLFTSQIVSSDEIREINESLISNGKRPAFAKQVIIGVKQLPNHSESFLAAASYQRTADALVSSAIIKKVDQLEGIKENIVVGNKMPVGTGMAEPDGKYDIITEELNYDEYTQANPLDISINIEEESEEANRAYED